jgi:Ca2+-transporting ATPase
LNALVGFVQESRAERALDALEVMTAPRARVRRNGRALVVPAADVVPGDVLLLEAGDVVAADAALVESTRLSVAEAALTGESAPVEKSTRAVADDVALADRTDQVFMGTSVKAGTGVAVVRATGRRTELGHIATLLDEARDIETPLHKQLERLGRILIVICVAVVLVVATIGLLRGDGWLSVLLTAVSLAVAAVPEGLVAIVTVALAVGLERLAAQHVLVRRLASVETLGCVTVICTDKTGTLTTGQMVVRDVWEPRGEVLQAAAACCDSELPPDGEAGRDVAGDPTEIAILLAAREKGIERATIEAERPRVTTNPFDADVKYMSVLRQDGTLYVKGAAEALFPRCKSLPAEAEETVTRLAAKGLRVLAVAVGQSAEPVDLTLVGLIGIADPPRPEVPAAIAAARRAGVETIMITGDHPETARAIAIETGVLAEGDDPARVVRPRATPEQKLTLVRQLVEEGEVVAMTGDGVNDAPALKEAHIGIAMGVGGTEVTRRAAAMVLADDNYASIVAGIKEGRGVYENITKTLVYLLGGNMGELLLMLLAGIIGVPSPLLPIHILWVNLVTDGLPALALVMDEAPKDALDHPPRPPNAPILGRHEWFRIGVIAVAETAVVLSVYLWAHAAYGLGIARTLAFTVLGFSQLMRAFPARSTTLSLFASGLPKAVIGVVGVSAVIQLVLPEIGLFAQWFELEALSASQLGLAAALGCIPAVALELVKWGARAHSSGASKTSTFTGGRGA